jgi:predicted dehydrogenase
MTNQPSQAPSLPLGVAVIGLGVGEQHARSFAASPAFSLRLLCDRDLAKAQRLAAELGVPKVCADFPEALDTEGVELISIASFDADHAPQILAALAAGKHVFVEKPLCRTRAELGLLRQAWEAAGAPLLASNLVLRRAALIRRFEEIIQSGRLGELYAFHGEYLYGRLHKLTDGWRGQSGYSVFLGGAIHLLDLLLQLSGQKPESVTSLGNNLCTRETVFQGTDYHSATFQFPSGLIGHIAANFGCVHPHHHFLRIYGTGGTLIYDDAGARLIDSRDPQTAAETIPGTTAATPKGLIIETLPDVLSCATTRRELAEREFFLMHCALAADEALANMQTIKL